MRHRPGFENWIEGSAFVDNEGNPILFYHGTDSDRNFNIFARSDESSIGYHFGDISTAHKRLQDISGDYEGTTVSIIPVISNARAPLRLTDHHTWSIRNVASELLDLDIINEEQFDYIYHTCDDNTLFAAIELAGYDSVVYANVTEGGGTSDSLIIWRAELVKSPYAARFDRNDPGLVPYVENDRFDYDCWVTVAEQIDECKKELLRLANSADANTTPTRGF